MEKTYVDLTHTKTKLKQHHTHIPQTNTNKQIHKKYSATYTGVCPLILTQKRTTTGEKGSPLCPIRV